MGFMRALLEVDHYAAAMGQRKRPSFVPPHLLWKVRVRKSQLAGVPIEVHTPARYRAGDATLLYLHGGGYVTCSPASHRHVIAALADLTGARVIAPAYRLAPEHPFPAALNDVQDVYRALLSELGSDRLLLAGDSAGGGLALSLALSLRDLAVPPPLAIALISPWVDLSLSHAELEPHAQFDYLRPRMLAETAQLYAGQQPLNHPLISPIYGDLSGLPPVLTVTGALEIFHDQNVRFVARARQHGVSIRHVVEPSMLHAFPAFSALVPQGRAALHTLAAFLREQLASHRPLTPNVPLSERSSQKSA